LCHRDHRVLLWYCWLGLLTCNLYCVGGDGRARSVSEQSVHYAMRHFARSWIWLCSVLRPRQHSIGYRSKDPTNSIKGVLFKPYIHHCTVHVDNFCIKHLCRNRQVKKLRQIRLS